MIFGVLTAWYISRYVMLRLRNQSTRHLLLSFVLTTVPFQIGIPLVTPTYHAMPGSFTAKLFFSIPMLASLIMLVREKNTRFFYASRDERWVTLVLILVLVSFCNPNNYALWGTGAFAWLFITCVVFIRLVVNNLNPAEILEGFYESFVLLCVLQAVLAVCFPLLGIVSVTRLFQAGGEEWSTRNGSRPGAVGVFVHPGNLALFTMMASCFFQACYLTNLKKKLSFALLLLNAMTIVLTYSRTSYLTAVVAQVAAYYVYRNADKPLVSWKSVFLGIVPTVALLYWIVFISPLSSNFLASNADEMYQARLDHWQIGLAIFREAPLLGVGLNTHLEYIVNNIQLTKIIHNEFLTTNPIHDIHIVILAETGIVGFALWILFLGYSIHKAKVNIAGNNNIVFSLTHIGVIVCFVFYGITDWSPLSHSIFPLFIFLTFLAYKFSFGPHHFPHTTFLPTKVPGVARVTHAIASSLPA